MDIWLLMEGETLNGDISDLSIKWEKFLRTWGLLRVLKIQLHVQLLIPLDLMISIVERGAEDGGGGSTISPLSWRKFF